MKRRKKVVDGNGARRRGEGDGGDAEEGYLGRGFGTKKRGGVWRGGGGGGGGGGGV